MNLGLPQKSSQSAAFSDDLTLQIRRDPDNGKKMRTAIFFAFFLIFFCESAKKKKPDGDSVGLFCKFRFLLPQARIKIGHWGQT
jgi:hypothetical protein